MKIAMYDLEGYLLEVFNVDSASELYSSYDNEKSAAGSNRIDVTNISRCCNGKQKTSGGFEWSFFNKLEE
jgi:hypothetical protein